MLLKQADASTSSYSPVSPVEFFSLTVEDAEYCQRQEKKKKKKKEIRKEIKGKVGYVIDVSYSIFHRA